MPATAYANRTTSGTVQSGTGAGVNLPFKAIANCYDETNALIQFNSKIPQMTESMVN